MNKKVKRIGYKIGIIPIILVLSIGLLAGGAVLAEDDEVEPQATATGTVTPNMVTNDGASVLHFSWDIYDWDGTADYYTFQVNVRGEPDNPLYIQYSDGAGMDTFPPGDISMGLQNVNGTVGAPAVHIRQPDDPSTHDWTVPDTVAPGLYAAWVNLYLEGQAAAAAGAYIPFSIEQTVEVRKFNDMNGNGIKDAGETEISGTWDVQIWDPSMVSVYSGTMPAVFNVQVAGTFTATETLKAGWVVTTPPGSPSVTQTFDIPETKDVIWFGNMEQPGNLRVYKYEDEAGDGSYDGGEPLLDGWTFTISGPTGGSGSTVGGNVTFTDIPGGTYTITETIQGGWRCTDPGSSGVMTGVVVTAGQTTEVYFGNQELGDLIIFKYNDLDDSGTYNAGDTPWGGWGFSVSGVGGIHYTDGTGYVTIPDLVPGAYTVTEVSAAPGVLYWECTDPGSGKQKVANVPSGGTDEVWFGNREVEHRVPTLGQWGIIAMSTVFVGLLVWFGVRRRRLAQMN